MPLLPDGTVLLATFKIGKQILTLLKEPTSPPQFAMYWWDNEECIEIYRAYDSSLVAEYYTDCIKSAIEESTDIN